MFEPEDTGFRVLSPGEVPIDEMEVRDLLELRAKIDSRLPATSLRQMNLEEELVIQYQTAKALQTSVINGNEEANKKSQTINACAAALQALVKMQAEYHTAERLKNIESRLIRALDKVPKEYMVEFFAWYEGEDLE